ncbi:MAG: hypothetical protein QM653_12490 [Dysgonomonas sp.]|uniref:hypothetical protein n=1 Tax=Dysgonomonas sp. TaxID=1891233 RepID=UPI0039E65044
MSKLVTFEQAKKLNELGYSVPSAHGYYTKGGGEYVTIQQYREDRKYQLIPSWLYANTVSDALQWIREKKGIDCAVNLVLTKCYEGVKILDGEFSSGLLLEVLTSQYESYTLAESALLDELLTYLEENNHGNK